MRKSIFILIFAIVNLVFQQGIANPHFISFIIPCYNCENTVEESILSIYKQQLTIPFEVICTDDCSTDNTKNVLEQCAIMFPNLYVYSHLENRGGGATRNTCTSKAKGDLIFNLDSDNVLIPNSVQKLIQLIDETGYDVASFYYARFFQNDYNETEKWMYSWEDNTVDLNKLLLNEHAFPSYQGNYLYTRKCAELVGGYPEDCGALDTTAFGLSLLAAGCKIAIHPDHEMYYWHRTSNDSYWLREFRNNTLNFQKSLRNIIEVFDEKFSDYLIDPDKANECLDLWANLKFTLTSPEILESLFKAYKHKMNSDYVKSAKEFLNCIELGSKAEKIYQEVTKTIGLNYHLQNSIHKPGSFVTYSLDGGRFGDQLINYMKALWVSCKYDIPLIYHPFSYSNLLELSSAHPQLSDQKKKELKKIEVKDNGDIIEKTLGREANLYSISFQSQVLNDEDWENEAFKEKLSNLIKPKQPFDFTKIPSGYVSIAIHIRSRNNGFDSSQDVEQMPTKFPPYSFYLNALKQIASHFKNNPLYVYIFTDDPNPQVIKNKFSKKWDQWKMRQKIIFNCRKSENRHNKNVLEDFFDMMRFDCIIHPDSMFSLGASIIAAPIIEVMPLSWDNCRMDENNCLIRDKEGNVIIDNLFYFRTAKGKSVSHTKMVSVEDELLY